MRRLFWFTGRVKKCLAIGCVGCAVAAAAPEGGRPAFNDKDLAILGQTLHFIDPPPEGEVRIAVVFNPVVAGSQDEAAQIVREFPPDFTVSGIPMHPFSVSLDQIGQTTFGAVISTAGAGTGALREALSRQHAICVTNHPEQVSAGYCQIYITSQPSVDIRLNQSASDAANVHFATAFRLMVRAL